MANYICYFRSNCLCPKPVLVFAFSIVTSIQLIAVSCQPPGDCIAHHIATYQTVCMFYQGNSMCHMFLVTSLFYSYAYCISVSKLNGMDGWMDGWITFSRSNSISYISAVILNIVKNTDNKKKKENVLFPLLWCFCNYLLVIEQYLS